MLIPIRMVKEWESKTMEGVKPIKGEFMSGLPLWVTRAQSCWGLSDKLRRIYFGIFHLRGDEAGLFIYQILCLIL